MRVVIVIFRLTIVFAILVIMDTANPELRVEPFAGSPEHTPPVKRLARGLGKAAALLAVGVGGALAGSHVFETHSMIGGHQAETTLTHDGFATFDLGMPGEIAFPLDSPLQAGAHINIKEMPTNNGPDIVKPELTQEDIQTYAQIFTTIDDDIRHTGREVAKHAAFFGVESILLAAGLYKVIGKQRRAELFEMAQYVMPRKLVIGGLAVCMLGAGASADTYHSDGPKVPDGFTPVSEAFDSTPLEGAFVSGKWMELVNTYGVEIINYIDKNNAFYEQSAQHMQLALGNTPIFHPSNSRVNMLFMTDLHCNLGMSKVIKSVVDTYEIGLAVDGGDMTASGSEFEEKCVREVAKSLKGIPRIVVEGNHDDASVTGPMMAHAGYKVLAGKPIEVAGVTFLGDSDPRRSVFGTPIHQIGAESVLSLGHRLADEACDSEKPIDVLLVHDPQAATETLQRNCANFSLSGHTHHEQIKHEQSTEGTSLLQFTGGSAGGVSGDMPTFGPLLKNASLLILSIDTGTHQVMGYQDITVKPNTQVVVGPRVMNHTR